MTLIDTAEMYASGGAEEVVREAIAGRRDEVFLVSKVLPSNASRAGTIRACEASLKRLGTDRIDLYLLHWRGGVPLAETVAGFETLKAAGKILHWGVSNFDAGDMDELARVAGGKAVQTNQVLYNLTAAASSLTCCRKRGGRHSDHGLFAGRAGRPDRRRAVEQVAAATWRDRRADRARLGAAPARRHRHSEGGSRRTCPRQPRRARLKLTADDLAELDAAFPPPKRKRPLEMI